MLLLFSRGKALCKPGKAQNQRGQTGQNTKYGIIKNYFNYTNSYI